MSFLSELFPVNKSPLMERAGFANMFDDIVRIAGEVPVEVTAVQADARAALKRSDRVVWYLRLWKVGYVQRFVQGYASSGRVPPGYADRVVADYARKARISEEQTRNMGWAVMNDPNLLTTLGHFLSLPIRSIDKRVFAFDDPETILGEFKRAETEWQKDTKGAFQDDSAVEMMRFANGLAWYDLGRGACDLEAEAMGHCGNNASHNNANETILSLRQTHEVEGQTMHKPILSFILDQHGLLGEMKGRFNEKPSERYFNEIVALLKSDRVVGIKGGGYEADANFSIDDLPTNVRDELLTAKPALGGLYALYKLWGIESPVVQELVITAMHEKGISPRRGRNNFEVKGSDVVITRFKDLHQFAGTVNDNIVSGMINLHRGLTQHIYENITETQVSAILRVLDTATYAKVMRSLGLKAVAHHDPRFEEAIALASKRLHGNAYGNDLTLALTDALNEAMGTNDEARLEMGKRIKDYIAVGWQFEGGYQNVKVPVDYNQPVDIFISAEDLVSMLTANAHDVDYMEAAAAIRTSGWFTLDTEALGAEREENGLSSAFGHLADLLTDPLVARLLDEGKWFDARVAAAHFAEKFNNR